MVNGQTYLQKLLEEIERKKAQNKTGVYRIDERITDETADILKQHFAGTSYRVEIKKCTSCKNTYDILIFF